ncbi:NAD(P)-dependent dehydrogenase, short-chain alcohol dehydrogenase family [Asanoa ishikariensis]|uniref:NAD(P)-dependent dehydrogenase, short-chain alcohol dehydrogenase family n=1 Tax=Asanoa ishikariensis TaxID=137265 RepID=A0A1H3L087_9ACTN|nr:SDR family oxidoreductase [Asanoa ishikariensis]SDY57295.1 NAD(P)-dependent dehydrogenase, short-chain alcohol dehydrogenase family [Asanoa ishikariensis]
MTDQRQRVVVLGGTSGLGFAVADLLSARGAEVVVVSSRQASVDRALAKLPAGTEGSVADLRDEAAIEAVFDRIGPFDHLVYTAGEPLRLLTVKDMPLDQAQEFFGLRFFSALTAVKHAVPRIRAGGSITLTTGSAGERPSAGWSVAASICGAVSALTKALAIELAPVRVNAVAPGVTRSPLWAGLGEDAQDAYFRQVGEAMLVGRVGETDEIARAYAYLIDQPFSTGTILGVDGGALLV